MTVQKLTIDEVPKDVLGDLESLIADSKKEYVAIGSSYYAISPMPAIVLMEVLGKFMETLEKIRRRVIEQIVSELTPEQQEKFNPATVFVTIRDMLKDQESLEFLKALLEKILEGVDPKDFESITTNQLAKVIDIIVKVNIDTLPQSFREALIPPPADTESLEDNGEKEFSDQQGTIKNP